MSVVTVRESVYAQRTVMPQELQDLCRSLYQGIALPEHTITVE